MALTISLTGDWLANIGNRRSVFGTLTFDSSYLTGGETLTPANVGLGLIDRIRFNQGEDGYVFKYDHANEKVLAYRSGGFTPTGTISAPTFTGTAEAAPLIVEEVVSVSGDTGTLANAPAYIVAVDVTAGGTTGGFTVVPTGETPATTQCAVTFPSGVLTFAAGDAVTSVRVTYFPARTGTMFVQGASNVVIDETAVASASKVNLANRAAAVQYVYDTTGGTVLTPIPVGEAPSSGEYALDIDDSGNTSIDTNADIDGNTLKVTYFRYSALPSPFMHVDDVDLSLSSEAYDWTENGHESVLVVPAHGVHAVGETGAAANVASVWAGPSVTAANLRSVWTPSSNSLLTNEDVALVTLAIPWLRFAREILDRPTTPAGTVSAPTLTGDAVAATPLVEVSNGVNLGAVVVEFEAVGR